MVALRGAAGVSPADRSVTHRLILPARYVFTVPTKNWLGARDLSRRNVGTSDPRWEIARLLRQLIFLRTEVRAPFARVATTVNRYLAEQMVRQIAFTVWCAGARAANSS